MEVALSFAMTHFCIATHATKRQRQLDILSTGSHDCYRRSRDCSALIYVSGGDLTHSCQNALDFAATIEYYISRIAAQRSGGNNFLTFRRWRTYVWSIAYEQCEVITRVIEFTLRYKQRKYRTIRTGYIIRERWRIGLKLMGTFCFLRYIIFIFYSVYIEIHEKLYKILIKCNYKGQLVYLHQNKNNTYQYK